MEKPNIYVVKQKKTGAVADRNTLFLGSFGCKDKALQAIIDSMGSGTILGMISQYPLFVTDVVRVFFNKSDFVAFLYHELKTLNDKSMTDHSCNCHSAISYLLMVLAKTSEY